MELLVVKYILTEAVTCGAMRVSIRVLYSTEAVLRRNDNQPGKGYERSFGSLEAAKSAPFPEGCAFAYIPLDDGFWIHSAKFGWEFHEEA